MTPTVPCCVDYLQPLVLNLFYGRDHIRIAADENCYFVCLFPGEREHVCEDGGIHALLGRSLEFRMAVRTLLGFQATFAATDRLDTRLSLSDKNSKSGLAIQKGLEPVAKLSVVGAIGINRSVNTDVIQTKRDELGRDCSGR